MIEQQPWVIGFHAVQAVLETKPETALALFVASSRKDARLQAALALAKLSGVSTHRASLSELDKLTNRTHHQGIALKIRPDTVQDESWLFNQLSSIDRAPLLLILDGVTDPHNLGACLRSADAAGVDAVIVPKDNACGITSSVRKAASGAAETIPFVSVTNLARTMRSLKKQGIWLYGLIDSASQDIYQHDFSSPTAVVLGSEGKGLRRLVKAQCDHLVAIPMLGAINSLNVSVATGICLYEVRRQRR